MRGRWCPVASSDSLLQVSGLRCLPLNELRLHPKTTSTTERLLHDHADQIGLERLAREHIQIHIICLFTKVGANVRCLDQLDQRVALLVPRAEHDNLRLAIRNHVNLLHQSVRERLNVARATDCGRRAVCDVQHQVISPTTHMLVYFSSVKM